MKKVIVYLGVLALGFALILNAPAYIARTYVTAEVLNPKQIMYTETVSADGVVEYCKQQCISSAVPVVAKEVFVSVGDVIAEGDLIATVDQKQTLQAVYALASSVMANASMSTALTEHIGDLLKVDAGALLQSGETMIPTQIVADKSGKVVAVDISTSALDAQTNLVTLADDGSMQAVLSVAETDIAAVSLGQVVTLTGTGMARRTYTGRISEIAKSATQKTNGLSQQTVVKVTVAFDNPDDAVKAGYNVKGQIAVSDPKQALVVPYTAVNVDDDGNEFVYVFQDAVAVRREVTTGTELAQGIEICTGLSQADMILADATKIEKNNQKIKARPYIKSSISTLP